MPKETNRDIVRYAIEIALARAEISGDTTQVSRLNELLKTADQIGIKPTKPMAVAVDLLNLLGNRYYNAIIRGKIIHMPPSEKGLLSYFVDNEDRIVTLREIIRKRASRRMLRPDYAMPTLVFRLRKTIEFDPEDPQILQTIPGEGYLYNDPKNEIQLIDYRKAK